jgi:glutathione S-transferase
MPLEEVSADRDTRVVGFRQSLEPARIILAAQPYLAGGRPLYADDILFGCFMWARSISSFRVLTSDDPIYSWRERMLDGLSALARKSPIVIFSLVRPLGQFDLLVMNLLVRNETQDV